MIKIKAPIWKTRSIGIADYKLCSGVNEIRIEYRDKSGDRIYPYDYVITGTRARTYPIQNVKGVVLRIIPIADLEMKGGVDGQIL